MSVTGYCSVCCDVPARCQRRLWDGRASFFAQERFQASLKLAELPRNSAPNRYRLRCELTGRSRGNYRKFKLCRVQLRELAAQGQIPGMVKSSW